MAERYAIDEAVRIIDIDHPARILQILIGFDGVQYQVAYWHNGDRKLVWLYPYEICADGTKGVVTDG